ncbi:MAG: flagellar motor stator protein MotA [Nitrospinae bacterium]|nr:flagellar motor stator protein MotA [Nitrospinota bacterium]
MVAILGIIGVFVAVIGGYLMEHGNLALLLQPAELVIIGGAAAGAMFIASPMSVIKAVMGGLKNVFGGKTHSKKDYIQLLQLLNEFFQKIRKDGLASIESHIEKPQSSDIFRKYPIILHDHHALYFITDTFRVVTTTKIASGKLSQLLDTELDTHHDEMMVSANSVTFVADSLPGLGIVAAVLGVVITMQKMSEPPEVLGHSIGAALVGTFLGILMSYGFVGPMAKKLEHLAAAEGQFLRVIKETMVAFVGGEPAQIAIEFGRRVIPSNVKPTFAELEEVLRKMKDAK